MISKKFIAVNDFCIHHNIEISFINALQQNGLIEVAIDREIAFIDSDQLRQVEQYIRFYYDLDINFEGIETITHLLHRMNVMNDEIVMLRNRLMLYE